MSPESIEARLATVAQRMADVADDVDKLGVLPVRVAEISLRLAEAEASDERLRQEFLAALRAIETRLGTSINVCRGDVAQLRNDLAKQRAKDDQDRKAVADKVERDRESRRRLIKWMIPVIVSIFGLALTLWGLLLAGAG